MPIYLGDELAPQTSPRTLLRWVLRSLLPTPSATLEPTSTTAAIDPHLQQRSGVIERCDRCQFSVQDGMRECHRNPPALVYDERHAVLTSTWPTVDDEEWCGDFRAR